jgi:hypothetical protein
LVTNKEASWVAERKEARGAGLVDTGAEVAASIRPRATLGVLHAFHELLSNGHNKPGVGRLECIIGICFEES